GSGRGGSAPWVSWAVSCAQSYTGTDPLVILGFLLGLPGRYGYEVEPPDRASSRDVFGVHHALAIRRDLQIVVDVLLAADDACWLSGIDRDHEESVLRAVPLRPDDEQNLVVVGPPKAPSVAQRRGEYRRGSGR